MKRFTEYLNEDFDPAIYNSDGGISIEDPTVVDAINSNLEVATACACRTPYNSLEEIRKVLAYYKIFLPKSIFLDQTDGNDVFEISQFGEKTGMNNQGEVVTASESSLFVYFEWSVNERGMFDTFACICNQEELDDILADFDSETGDDINEEVMPDLKKKMGAKKVTLPNMMRKEETINEVSYKLAKSAEHEAAKRYYPAYDDEKKAREELQKKKTPEARKGAEDAKAARIKAKDRVIKFQQYADKKKPKEENRTFDTARAFADIPVKAKKTPATSAYRAARKLARKAKENAKDKKK